MDKEPQDKPDVSTSRSALKRHKSYIEGPLKKREVVPMNSKIISITRWYIIWYLIIVVPTDLREKEVPVLARNRSKISNQNVIERELSEAFPYERENLLKTSDDCFVRIPIDHEILHEISPFPEEQQQAAVLIKEMLDKREKYFMTGKSQHHWAHDWIYIADEDFEDSTPSMTKSTSLHKSSVLKDVSLINNYNKSLIMWLYFL